MSEKDNILGTINLIPIKKSDEDSNDLYSSENDNSPKIASAFKKDKQTSNKRQSNLNKHVRISLSSENNIISSENLNNKLLINKEINEDDLDLKLLFENCFEGENTLENSNKIPNCSILIYGAKASFEEIEYSFCKSCDSNLINPICIECINNCHKGHNIKKNFMKGHIQCFVVKIYIKLKILIILMIIFNVILVNGAKLVILMFILMIIVDFLCVFFVIIFVVKTKKKMF